MKDLSDESLDVMLRDAMQARPLPEPLPDLAARAMLLARQSAMETAALERRLARLSLFRRRVQVASALAACLLVAVLYVGYRAFPSDFSLFGTTSSASTETASNTTPDSTTVSTSTDSSTTSYALFGIGILVITALGMSVGGSLRTPAVRFDGPFVPSLR